MWHKTDFDMLPERAFLPRGCRVHFAGSGMTMEGGKGGGDTPPPDPALIAAQIRSLGVQDDMMRQIMRTSADMMPLQKEQMEFGLKSARTAYDQSQNDREFMLSRREKLSGLQDTIVDDAKNFDVATKGNEMAAEGAADVNSGFANAEAQQRRNQNRMGVNPNSGKAAVLGNQTAIAKAVALATAGNSARTQAQDLKYKLTDRASNALAGYPSMGMQATGAGAAMGGLGLNYANQGLQGMNSGFGQAGGMAGQSAQGYGSAWSAQSNAYQQDQASQAQASAATGQAIGSIVGTAGGMIMV